MSNNALYFYGVVKGEVGLELMGAGINKSDIYTVTDGEFSAIVHNCEEKPYVSEDPEKIKVAIIEHNNVLNEAIKNFQGIIPLPFNTIIKKGNPTQGCYVKLCTAPYNLKNWLIQNRERLEIIWNKIKGKKEYGLRIYYDRNKLMEEALGNKEIRKIKDDKKEKQPGLNYLLNGKVKYKSNEIVYNKIIQLRQTFCGIVQGLATSVKVNTSKISLDEEKDLLFSLSILTDEQQINQIKKVLERESHDFSFQFAGPFAPYSFVENETL